MKERAIKVLLEYRSGCGVAVVDISVVDIFFLILHFINMKNQSIQFFASHSTSRFPKTPIYLLIKAITMCHCHRQTNRFSLAIIPALYIGYNFKTPNKTTIALCSA